MADRYAITGQQNAAAPADTCTAVEAVNLTRGELYDLVFGSSDGPADVALRWEVMRFTAAGTRTAVVPAPLDPAAPAAQLGGGENHTAEPTYTAATELLDFGLHQRATYRWIASPGGEFTIPAVAANGIGARVSPNMGNPLVDCTMHYEE